MRGLKLTLCLVGVVVLAGAAGASAAPFAYITDTWSNDLYIIDTAANAVVATAGVGKAPVGVVVRPDGARVCVTNSADNTVSVIYTSDNVVWDLTPVGHTPLGTAVSPDGSRVYVANYGDGTVTV